MQPPVPFRQTSRRAPTSVEPPPLDALELFEPESSIGRTGVDSSIRRPPARPVVDQRRPPAARVQVRPESPQRAAQGAGALWFVVGAACAALIALGVLWIYSLSPLALPSVASPLGASHWVTLRSVDSSWKYVKVTLLSSD